MLHASFCIVLKTTHGKLPFLDVLVNGKVNGKIGHRIYQNQLTPTHFFTRIPTTNLNENGEYLKLSSNAPPTFMKQNTYLRNKSTWKKTFQVTNTRKFPL